MRDGLGIYPMAHGNAVLYFGAMFATEEGREATRKLLVIDDAALMQVFVQSAMGDLFDVHSADTGQEGIDKAAEIHPDVILCDMMMPGLTGVETIAQLKFDPALRDIPVVLMSGGLEEVQDSPVLKAQVAAM